jgi:leucyl/phenylalanyl-tRNA--protein transferase
MADGNSNDPSITPQLLLRAYASGIFPMAESADDPDLFWVEPRMRGILPLDAFHIPASLRKTMRREPFEVSIDRDFEAVIDNCAASAPGREKTWINATIRDLYGRLHRMGYCHSVECRRDGELVGGLYGLSLGAAFFGESMFSRADDASKVALVHLVHRLRLGGYRLLDAQFVTAHLQRFGAIEVPRRQYMKLLEDAISRKADFYCVTDSGGGASSVSILQSFSQMS